MNFKIVIAIEIDLHKFKYILKHVNIVKISKKLISLYNF